MDSEITLTATEDRIRVDLFLARELSEFSRSLIQRMIRDGYILVNGEKTRSQFRLRTGDRVKVFPPPGRPAKLTPEDIPLDIIYEDDDMIVVNKARGMVVHPATSHENGTLVNALLFHFSKLSKGFTPDRPGIIHRLDMGTSGVMVVCKTDRMQAGLSRMFQERKVDKWYYAIVKGIPETSGGRIDMPIGRDPANRKRMTVTPSGREAVSEFSIKGRFRDCSFLEIKLFTGRTHQVRVHMAHIGHPLLNDETYGYKGPHWLIDGPALHAARIGFTNPLTDEYIEFKAPLPDDMTGILEQLREAA